jgi:hypothetical protein
MTAPIPTTEPLQARAGMTWQWRREDLADYPASTWTLKYWFKKTGSTGANFSITASADGANFSISVAATTTQGYTAGDYTWAAVVTAGSEAFEVDHGFLKLLSRYDQAANLDDRTHARKVLDAINAVLEGRATLDQQEYTIGNRSLKRMPIADLIKLKSVYEQMVASETAADRLAQGRSIGGKIQVRL